RVGREYRIVPRRILQFLRHVHLEYLQLVIGDGQNGHDPGAGPQQYALVRRQLSHFVRREIARYIAFIQGSEGVGELGAGRVKLRRPLDLSVVHTQAEKEAAAMRRRKGEERVAGVAE